MNIEVEDGPASSSCLPSLRCGHASLASRLLWVAEAPDAFLILADLCLPPAQILDASAPADYEHL